MSHKKKLTWYQLWLRIGKMQIAKSQSNSVQVRVDGVVYPAELSYEDNGQIAYIDAITH